MGGGLRSDGRGRRRTSCGGIFCMHSQIRSDEEARARHAVPALSDRSSSYINPACGEDVIPPNTSTRCWDAVRSTASTAESRRDLRLVCQAPLGPTHRDPELSVAEKIEELLLRLHLSLRVNCKNPYSVVTDPSLAGLGLLQVGPAVPVRLAATPLLGDSSHLARLTPKAFRER